MDSLIAFVLKDALSSLKTKENAQYCVGLIIIVNYMDYMLLSTKLSAKMLLTESFNKYFN